MRYLSLVAMLLGLLPTFAPVTHAQTDPYIVYFPWVANGEMIGGQGPWYGVLSFQNRSDDFCALQVFFVKDGQWPTNSQAQMSLRAGESRSISASSLPVPSPGSPMRFEATCEIVATVKQYTPNVRSAPWSDGAQIVTGYTGLGEPDLAASRATQTSAWFLPIVQTNSDWNTFVRIANLSQAAGTDVTVEIYPNANTDGAGGAVMTLQRQVNVAETWTIDALASLGSEFVGFARISADREIGVIARRVKPDAMMAMTNVAVAADGDASPGSYQSAAPLLFNAYNGWNTGITMANVTDEDAIVTLQYFPSGGGMLREESLAIAARSMQYIYTPGTVEQAGFVGSATILSNVPIVAAVDEVKYETSEALSYMASGAAQHAAAIPIVFREDPANGLNDNSGISIVNLDPLNEQTVRLRLRDRTGVDLLDVPIAVRLPAGGNSFVYMPFIREIPPGTYGSATLESSNPAGFVAISNNINYAAGGDGSVVFSASGNGGVYYVPAPAQ